MLPLNPFQSLDVNGMGRALELAVRAAKVGWCLMLLLDAVATMRMVVG